MYGIIEAQQDRIAELESKNTDLKQALAQAKSEVSKGAKTARDQLREACSKFFDAAAKSLGKQVGPTAKWGVVSGVAIYAGSEGLASVLEHLQNILSGMAK